jgi:hypothetical protein
MKRGRRITKKYYHFTRKENLNSILENGLIPNSKYRYITDKIIKPKNIKRIIENE